MSRIPNTPFKEERRASVGYIINNALDPLKYKFAIRIQIFNPNPGEEDPPDLD
jgi:hypothetical protein